MTLKMVFPFQTAFREKISKIKWLPFLNTYRKICRAPEPAFRRLLDDVREFWYAA